MANRSRRRSLLSWLQLLLWVDSSGAWVLASLSSPFGQVAASTLRRLNRLQDADVGSRCVRADEFLLHILIVRVFTRVFGRVFVVVSVFSFVDRGVSGHLGAAFLAATA